MSRRRLATNAVSSMIQVVVSGVVLFELYRFIIRHLSVKEIGVWSLVLASTSVGRLADLGLGGGVVKFVAEDLGRNDRVSAIRTVFMAFVGMALLVTTACVISYPILYYVLGKLVVERQYLGLARELLPYALATLLCSALSGVALSGLDGCQRMDRRAITGITGALVQLSVAYVLVPRAGLKGLASGQIIQAITTLSLGTVFLFQQLRPSTTFRPLWDGARFKRLVRYGGSFQAAAVGQLLFEPLVKALLTRFGGLEFTGFYEMANRVLLQLRSVIVSAYQALVPHVAGGAQERSHIRQVYLSSYRLLFFLAVPYYSLIGVALPLFLTIWLGRFDPRFILTGMCCLIGWTLNTLIGPAYFLYLATGRLFWTVLSHIVIGALAAILGSLLGWAFGGMGVLVASCFALGCGSHVVSLAFHREYGIPSRQLLPRQGVNSVWVALASVGAIGTVSLGRPVRGALDLVPATMLVGLAALALFAISARRNENLRALVGLIRELLHGPRVKTSAGECP